MSIISKTQDFFKQIIARGKVGTSGTNLKQGLIQQVQQPQVRQQVQNVANYGASLSQKGIQLGQQLGQRIQQTPQIGFNPRASITRKIAPAVLGMAGSVPGEILRGGAQAVREVIEPSRFLKAPLYTKGNILGNPQNPTKAGIALDVASALPDVGDLGKAALLGGFGASILRSKADAKALKPLLPEIRNVAKMLGKMDEIPYLTPQQVDAAEKIVSKLKGSNVIKQIQKYNTDPKDYLNSLRVILGDTEHQILNPRVNVGLSTREVFRPNDTGKAMSSLKEELSGRKLSPQDALTSIKSQKIELPIEKKGVTDASQETASLDGSITDPVQKVISLLAEAKPMRAEQEALYSAERSRRAGAIAGIGRNIQGEGGFRAQLGALKGELPKVQFERIRNGLKQPEIDTLFNTVEKATMTPFEKISAKSGLAKLLGAEGGQIPVESELKLLGEIFPPEFIQAIQAKRPLMQKLWSGIQGALNLPRAIMATADLSAPLRQGIFFVSRPKQWGSAFKNMFKYAGSEKAYLGLMDDIKTRPNYMKMREAKLALTDMSDNLLSREENFMSNLPEKIPGFGTIAKGSNRAYSGFLNKLRADVFDDLVTKAEASGIKVQGRTLQDLGSFINSATGRGNLGKTLEKAAPILNATLFSPRLMASRLNLLSPATYVNYDPFVRKEALKSLLGFGATAGTVLALAKMGGAEVGNDPRSADFGKIKTGNTRYDVLGGFQQYIKLAAQLLSGQVVSSTTGKVITLGEGYKPLTRKDIIARFFESKEAPVASFITNLITGQTGIGEPVNVKTEVINRFIPMMLQDIYELAKDKDSVGQGLAMAMPGIFGAGSQTYGKQELVTGENMVGQPTSQIRPVQGLAETLSAKAFGEKPLGSSATYNVQSYYNQLKEMPKQEAASKFDEISKTNPELAKKLIQVIKDEQKGVTVQDQTLKAKGVASGDRATTIAKEFKKLKSNEEKGKLWEDYVRKGIITKEIAEQLSALKKRGDF